MNMTKKWAYSSLALLIVVLGTDGLIILLAYLWLNPPSWDLFRLFIFLIVSGGVSLVLGLGWMKYGSQNVRLYLQMVVTYLVSAAVVVSNVTITPYLMFTSAHDFNLLVLLLIFSGIISVVLALFVAGQVTWQVKQLVVGANRVAGGNLEARVPVGGSRELIELSQAFNSMATRLQASFEKQQQLEKARKELIAAISHDLRTPLASLRLMTEAITDGVADAQQNQIFVERIRSEVIYLSGLIDDLFELSQLDAGVLKIRPEPGNLADLISDTLESMRAQAANKQQHVLGQISGDLPLISYDPLKIQRVLNNLMSNAIRYTPEGGQIEIKTWQEAGFIKVSVSDNGEGIQPQAIEHIFQPFYRGERSRTREQGGAGLGLAIARGILEMHGGHITVTSKEGKGTCFIFALPLESSGPQSPTFR
jgi:signal transduction histidine kinase